MPQLVPFFFINQISFGFLTLFALIYISSKYLLPMYLKLYISRIFLVSL
jgi:F-type H+-transporting ATPase subunit 8